MKNYFFILLGIIILAVVAIVIQKNSKKINSTQKFNLINKCNNQSQSVQGIDPDFLIMKGDTAIFYKKNYDFFFKFPITGWSSYENFVQHYEYQLSFPQLEYSINLSTPNVQQNATTLEKGQKATIEFLVFNSYCEPIEAWYSLLPFKSSLSKRYIYIDGEKAIIAQTTKLHNVVFVIFNKNNWHYEFMMEVTEKKDFSKYVDILVSVASTFSPFDKIYDENTH